LTRPACSFVLPRRAFSAVPWQSSCVLVIFAGLPATGKSTIARELARQINASYLRIDSIEHAIRGAGFPAEDMFDTGYRVAYALAEENLRIGRHVVADSVNPIRVTRDAWLDVAKRAGVAAFEIEIICSDREKHRQRLETRVTDFPGSKPLTWQNVTSRQYDHWDRERLVIDTSKLTVSESVGKIQELLTSN
jgi:predicted kinase